MKLTACSTLALITLLVLAPSSTRTAAEPLGSSIPGNCVEHTTFTDGPDASGDYRCAGQAIEFHTGGVAQSPHPMWAGQWLFRDPSGSLRLGSCTFNRGIHPTIASNAQWVPQSFPNDPTGALSSYLAWKYGDTTDNLTAAALWAVFHYYAQDAAGPNRSADANDPLIPTLGSIEGSSGRADVQSRALALHHEAQAVASEWRLTVTAAADGTITVALFAGDTPVPEQPVSVLVSGSDIPLDATTSADGSATVTVSLPPGTVTVVATAVAPGPADVYRGEPAFAEGQGGQNLITGGATRNLRAEAVVSVVPATTVMATTTTIAPDPSPSTTSTIAATTTTTTVGTTTTVALPSGNLPRAGGGRDGAAAYLGTAFLVGGIGLLGTLRRPRTMVG